MLLLLLLLLLQGVPACALLQDCCQGCQRTH
jgi:hypothetical protein